MSVFDDPEIFRAVMESLPVGIYLVDREQKIQFWNAGAERITGYLRQDVVGHLCRENILSYRSGTDPAQGGPDTPDAIVMREGKAVEAEAFLHHKEGHRIPVRLRAVPVRNSHGSVVGIAETFEESFSASALDRRHNKLAAYGCLDADTGVLNRGIIEAHLKEHLAMHREHPVPFGVLCMQVDKLDVLRRTYGAQAVEEILRVAAHTIETSLRPTDHLGRWGENQFVAILNECNAEEAARAGERVRKLVSYAEVRWWGDLVPVTASIGGAAVHAGDSLESILGRAETMQQESAGKGGNCVTVATAPPAGQD